MILNRLVKVVYKDEKGELKKAELRNFEQIRKTVFPFVKENRITVTPYYIRILKNKDAETIFVVPSIEELKKAIKKGALKYGGKRLLEENIFICYDRKIINLIFFIDNLKKFPGIENKYVFFVNFNTDMETLKEVLKGLKAECYLVTRRSCL